MPAKNGRRLDEQGRFTPSWRHTRSENNCEALPRSPPDAADELALGDNQLLSQERIFGDQRGPAAKHVRGQLEDETKEVDHADVLHRPRSG